MNPIAVKIIAGLGISSVGSVGCYGVYEIMRAKDLKDELMRKGEKLITEESDWKTLATKYKDSSTKFENLESLTNTSGEEWKEIKNKCEEILKTKIDTNKEEYGKRKTEAENWCIQRSTNLISSNPSSTVPSSPGS